MKKIFYFLCLVNLFPLTVLPEEVDNDEIEENQFATAGIPTIQNESTPEQNLATLGGEPSAFINGCVNAITGNFIDSAIDLYAPGPDPLIVERIYTNTSGWSINEPEVVECKHEKHPVVTHSLKGMISTFADKKSEKLKIRPENFRKGLTNCSSSSLSGRTNPHSLQMDAKITEMHFTLRDGTKSRKQFEKQIIDKSKVSTDLAFAYCLMYQQKSNGIKTLFTYLNSPLGWAIQEITNINCAPQKLNSVKFDYDNFNVNQCMMAQANDNRSGKCEYKFKNRDPRYLHHVIPSGAPPTLYEYNVKTGFMTRKIRPNGCVMEIDYYDEANPYMKVEKKEHTHYGRVFSLRAPVGTDHQMYKTHQFFYEIYKDKHARQFNVTRVFDINDQETRYSYDTDSHLRSIEELGPQSRTHQFFWYKKDPDFDGNIMTKTLGDLSGILSCRHYIYDKSGNVLQDILFGNLTGRNQAPIKINEIGAPVVSGCEGFTIHCKYSEDGYNHLLNEQDGRKIVDYVYIPGTDFLQAKYVKDLTGKICYREFYSYNINGSIVKLISDDGNSLNENDPSITERHIIYIHYRDQFPIGLPQVIEEKYLELATNKEQLLKKIINVHDSFGRIAQQDHYDAHGTFRYSLKWEYDAHGNILKEVDALGNAATFSYDADDNLVTEQYPGNPFFTHHAYDQANRLILSEDIHNGFILTTRYEYNRLNQKIKTIDWYGQETSFAYDRLGRLTTITYPEVYNEHHKSCRPTEFFEYDIADNPIVKIDPKGHRTDIRYTIRGKPFAIHYQDGCEEKNEYTLEGLLEKSVAINGVTTNYHYDYLGRVIKKEISSPHGEKLQETSHYNYFHKLYEVDAAGQRTDYQYDYAGRLIGMTKGHAKTCYEYDACGRVSKVREYYGTGSKEFIAKIKEYDLLDRVIQERTETSEGITLTKVSFAYNERGERIQITSYHLSTPAITTFKYNAYGDIEKIIDPEGNTTQSHYHYDFINKEGQCVFAKETIDPLGNSLFLEFDTLSRPRYEIRKDAMGSVLQKREFFYDLVGNCAKQIEHVITPNEPSREVCTFFEYDCNHHLTKLIEAVNTVEQKQTYYVYNPYRQKVATIKPDNVELQYTYDGFGRLKSFKATDASFHYEYTYDANSNVIHVEDHHDKTSTQRIFDANNRLTQEILSNGLAIAYKYDGLSRLNKLTLPDKSTIDYKYNSLHLAQVIRGKYIHSYLNYNLGGFLEKAKMIGNSGEIHYSIDACQRLVGVKTSSWTEEIPENGFDKVGNLLLKNSDDALGKVEGIFSYDSLYQLKSEEGVSYHSFLHDSVYNLIKKDTYKHHINPLNQLLHDGLEKSCYDASGNLIEKGNLKLSYDALDRLVGVVDGKNEVVYHYDELNRRLKRLHYVDNKLQKSLRYIYQGQNEIGACDDSGHIVELRVLGLGKGAEIGAAILFELYGTVYAPVHDIAGNVCALINPENGATVEIYRYTAYGEEELYDEGGHTLQSSINPWRFSSKRTDSETAFVYFGRRYYNPATTRWVTADPIGFTAGPNLYAYLFNNPVNNFDLFGLEKCFGEEQFSYHQRRREESGSYERWAERCRNNERHSFSWSDLGDLGLFLIGAPCKIIGSAVYNVGREFMPVPILKDTFQFAGHLLQGNSPSAYTMSYREPHSSYRKAYEGSMKGCNAISLNGMGVSPEEANLRSLDLYCRLGGMCDVYESYNADHGFMSNFLECVCQFSGVETNSTQKFKDCATKATAALGVYGVTFLNAHSQGGLIAYDAARTLDKSITSKIDAYTIASPIALSEGMYGNVYNGAATWDAVTWGTRLYNGLKDFLGGKAAPIDVMRTQRGALKAHHYNGRTYEKSIRTRVKEIRKIAMN